MKHPFVQVGHGGRLAYRADAEGNRIPDFSHAGYGGGGVPIPFVPARVRVAPVAGDNGPRIQAAIDHLARLAPDSNGIRGAVVLERGRYPISGDIRITGGGIVLRGGGDGPDGTLLIATGTRRRTLIQVGCGDKVWSRAGYRPGPGGGEPSAPAERSRRRGGKDPSRGSAGRSCSIADPYVAVGAMTFKVSDAAGLRAGDRIVVTRPSTRAWIAAVGMNDSPAREAMQWQPGKMDVEWERSIVRIEGNRITIDAPITTALDARFGGGTVAKSDSPGRIREVGVENLRCESTFDPSDPSKDEQHSWMAVSLNGVENAWVANVTAVHFCSSAVQVGAGARQVTVEDCSSLAPVSEIGGYRRHSFHTSGELTLFLRCRAEDGIHDFTVGYLTAGPNVFLDCRADRALGWSGSTGSWASGVLFDNVHIDGSGLELDNLQTWNQGVGWSAANSALWQCSSSVMPVRCPPTANNWAVGVWSEFLGNGWWDQVNEFVRPESLYRAQLAQRLGDRAVAALEPRRYPAPGRNVPRLEDAVPDLVERTAPKPPPAGKPLELLHGWLVANGSLLTGRRAPEIQWWRGMVVPSRAPEFGASITRFVPGEIGPGLTDDLSTLTSSMVAADEVVVRHHYGLWYDRRRMDHERIRRATPDDWPPFFEQPFLRSGVGEAWDRMSRYDLTRYDPWYFGRLHRFAELGREKGLVLIDEMYFQHNILEAGAHWVDCPWRPANCLQATGFPEPPPFTDSDGHRPPNPDLGKRIFMAAQFYDVSNPVRRAIHRAFIRHCLDSLADEPNVIHTLTAENSGPLEFMQFWLDVVSEWERETGRHPLIALSAPKDVQDAILADPRRAGIVDVIDLTYWWRLDNGRLFAPPGGTTTTPRQYERAWRGGQPSATAIAAMAREYRARFPDKAIVTGLAQGNGWDFVSGGGSLPKLPRTTDPELRRALSRMQPAADVGLSARRAWALSEPARQYFICSAGSGALTVDLRGDARRGTTGDTGPRAPAPRGRPAAIPSTEFEVRRIDPKTGRVDRSEPMTSVDAGKPFTLSGSDRRQGLWWLVRRP